MTLLPQAMNTISQIGIILLKIFHQSSIFGWKRVRLRDPSLAGRQGRKSHGYTRRDAGLRAFGGTGWIFGGGARPGRDAFGMHQLAPALPRFLERFPDIELDISVTDRLIDLMEVSGNVNANNAETLLQLAATGVGIIRLSDVIVADGIRAGWLVPLLQDVHHREPLPLSAAYLPGKHKSPRVAAFVTFLVETFAAAPWRLAVAHAPLKKRRGSK